MQTETLTAAEITSATERYEAGRRDQLTHRGLRSDDEDYLCGYYSEASEWPDICDDCGEVDNGRCPCVSDGYLH